MEELRADCGRCAGLCCVAPAFARSSDFAVDKPAGQACANLQQDFRCGIHAELRSSGFAGCTVFDCFGAGQQVVQVTFGGADWRATPGIAQDMFAAFSTMRRLHELRWYLTEALARDEATTLHADLAALLAETVELCAGDAASLAEIDVAGHRETVNALLVRTGELVRAAAPGRSLNRRGADLVGKRLRRADLRGANLRGALLIGADLREADLRRAELIGADLRGADLRGADLTGALFLTQFQVNAVRGDAATRLPSRVSVPGHW
ncbi:MAG: pentapeptide repeat-containing protein [Pseudonocardia sp.]|nr:pentapeptide repeat-containing protein [Pseudonocardia sp.]